MKLFKYLLSLFILCSLNTGANDVNLVESKSIKYSYHSCGSMIDLESDIGVIMIDNNSSSSYGDKIVPRRCEVYKLSTRQLIANFELANEEVQDYIKDLYNGILITESGLVLDIYTGNELFSIPGISPVKVLDNGILGISKSNKIGVFSISTGELIGDTNHTVNRFIDISRDGKTLVDRNSATSFNLINLTNNDTTLFASSQWPKLQGNSKYLVYNTVKNWNENHVEVYSIASKAVVFSKAINDLYSQWGISVSDELNRIVYHSKDTIIEYDIPSRTKVLEFKSTMLGSVDDYLYPPQLTKDRGENKYYLSMRTYPGIYIIEPDSNSMTTISKHLLGFNRSYSGNSFFPFSDIVLYHALNSDDLLYGIAYNTDFTKCFFISYGSIDNYHNLSNTFSYVDDYNKDPELIYRKIGTIYDKRSALIPIRNLGENFSDIRLPFFKDLIVQSDSSNIYLFSPETEEFKYLESIKSYFKDSKVSVLTSSVDGNYLYLVVNKKIYLYDVAEDVIFEQTASTEEIETLNRIITKDANKIITYSGDESSDIRKFSVSGLDNNTKVELESSRYMPYLGFSYDDKYVFGLIGNGSLLVFDANTGKLILNKNDSYNNLAISNVSNTLVLRKDDSSIVVLKYSDPAGVFDFYEETQSLKSIAVGSGATIELDADISLYSDLSYSLHNSIGEAIDYTNIIHKSGNSLEFTANNLPTGVYTISLRHGKNTKSIKVLITE